MRAFIISLAVISSSAVQAETCASKGKTLKNLNYTLMYQDGELDQLERKLGAMMNRQRSDEEVEILTFSIEGLSEQRNANLKKWNELREVYAVECPPPTTGFME